jgi:Na+-transporting NADH:ubiquinone oxidoreductase subunit B
VPAWLFMLVVPADVGWMQLVFALALGLLVGRLLFGGPGKQIVSPALLALLFLYTAYPSAFDSSGSGPSPWVKWGGLPDGGTAWWPLLIGSDGALSAVSSPAACVLAGAFLVLIGVVSWRTLTGGLLGLVLASAVISWVGPPGPLTSTPWYIHAVSGGFAFGLVFLAADPDSAPLTPGGRWMLGLLTGVLTVLIRLADPSHPDGVLHAILLAALFAPLADEWFVRRALRLRRLREEAWP